MCVDVRWHGIYSWKPKWLIMFWHLWIISIQVNHKVINLSWITRMKMKPRSKTRFGIPFCTMVSMPIMHLTLHVDIQKMDASFQMGYKEGDRVFYMYAIDNLGEEMRITKEIEKGWDQYYKYCNAKFEHFVNPNMDLICCPTKCSMCGTRTI